MSVHACSSGGRCNAQGAGHETPAARHYQRKPPHYQQHQQHQQSWCNSTRVARRGGAALMVTRFLREKSPRGFSLRVRNTRSRFNIYSAEERIPELDIASRAAFISGLHSSVLPLLLRFRKIEKIQARVTPPAANHTSCVLSPRMQSQEV